MLRLRSVNLIALSIRFAGTAGAAGDGLAVDDRLRSAAGLRRPASATSLWLRPWRVTSSTASRTTALSRLSEAPSGMWSPESAFARSSMPFTIAANSALSSTMALRLSARTASSRSAQRCSICALALMTVSGVFSSCEASEMNCRSRANAPCSRSSIRSKSGREPARARLCARLSPTRRSRALGADFLHRLGQALDRIEDERRDCDRGPRPRRRSRSG